MASDKATECYVFYFVLLPKTALKCPLDAPANNLSKATPAHGMALGTVVLNLKLELAEDRARRLGWKGACSVLDIPYFLWTSLIL